MSLRGWRWFYPPGSDFETRAGAVLLSYDGLHLVTCEDRTCRGCSSDREEAR